MLILVAVGIFIMGLTAFQKGEIAWSRTKTLTGQTAQIIGIALMADGSVIGVVCAYLYVVYRLLDN